MLDRAHRRKYFLNLMKKLLLLTGALTCLLAVGCGEKEEEQALERKVKAPSLTSKQKPVPIAPASGQKPDTVESLANELGQHLEEMDRAMKAVSDVTSAKVAAETVTRISEDFVSISQRLLKLEIPSDGLKRQISAEMDARQAEMVQSRGSQEEFMSSLPDDARPNVEKAMEAFHSTMNGVDEVMTAYFEVSDEGGTGSVPKVQIGPDGRPTISPSPRIPPSENPATRN
jgi:hypothetical protein